MKAHRNVSCRSPWSLTVALVRLNTLPPELRGLYKFITLWAVFPGTHLDQVSLSGLVCA